MSLNYGRNLRTRDGSSTAVVELTTVLTTSIAGLFLDAHPRTTVGCTVPVW
jgi:hypothetical protein